MVSTDRARTCMV
ncbi:hypothetical protein C4E04_02375 [Microvirga sp. 17 mud 1-3]|nr:hypothetical protein C4E04_02375 [Microvirga sp. 17 mud 1-3]